MTTVAEAHGGVVLLHGIAAYSGVMWRMARALEAEGFATLNLTYPSLTRSLVGIADGLLPRVSAFADGIDGPLHFVGHSLGGLVIRAYVERHRPHDLGRVVMLGTPNQGSALADVARRLRLHHGLMGPVGRHLISRRAPQDEALLGDVDYPLGVVAGTRPAPPHVFAWAFDGPNDGKVTVSATRVTGMSDHLALPIAHNVMPNHPQVIAQTIAFLRNGQFDACA